MTEKLGVKLWALIEKWQGKAYISDAITEMPNDKVLTIAVNALESARRQVKILTEFVRSQGHKANTPQTFTITWSTDDTCWVATSNHHSLFSGHGDTPAEALSELQIATANHEELEDIHTQLSDALNDTKVTVTHTIAALHIVNLQTNESAFVVGYLVSETGDNVVITNSIHAASGAAYVELVISQGQIRQRYSLPVTWWLPEPQQINTKQRM